MLGDAGVVAEGAAAVSEGFVSVPPFAGGGAAGIPGIAGACGRFPASP
jgi:hypothetical protein